MTLGDGAFLGTAMGFLSDACWSVGESGGGGFVFGYALGWAGWGIWGCIGMSIWPSVPLIGLSWCAAGHATLSLYSGFS